MAKASIKEKSSTEEVVSIKRTYENLHRLGRVRFLPGINIISKADMDYINGNPGLKAGFDSQINEGRLVVISGTDENGNKTGDIVSMKADDALRHIKEIYDVTQLENLKAREIEMKNRGHIIVAIDKQIEEMKKPIKRKKQGNVS